MYLPTYSALSSDHLPLLMDTRCRSSFLNLPDRPDFRRTDWVKFQACLKNKLPSTLKLPNEVEIDTYVEELFSAIIEALAVSTPKSRPHDDPRTPKLAGIQDETLLKNRLRRQWKIDRDPLVSIPGPPKAGIRRRVALLVLRHN